METSKNTQSMCQKIFSRNGDLLLLREGKGRYGLLKDFSTFMYDHTLYRRRKHFCHYFFLTKEILKCHMNGYFRINGKQRIKIPKRVNMLDSILRGK